MVSSGGVTIQKATIGLSGQSTPVSVSRTIALPYGTSSSIVTSSQPTLASLATSISASGKLIASSTSSTTTLSAIPVARVCPQPLGSVSSNNLVTISTSGTLTGSNPQDGVFITRTNAGHPLQQLAINLSTSGNGNQFQNSANNSNNKVRQNMNVVTHLNLPKINLPTQPARLINFQGQNQFMLAGGPDAAQHHMMEQQQQRLPTNSPRPSILRRREGERELILPGKASVNLVLFKNRYCLIINLNLDFIDI